MLVIVCKFGRIKINYHAFVCGVYGLKISLPDLGNVPKVGAFYDIGGNAWSTS